MSYPSYESVEAGTRQGRPFYEGQEPINETGSIDANAWNSVKLRAQKHEDMQYLMDSMTFRETIEKLTIQHTERFLQEDLEYSRTVEKLKRMCAQLERVDIEAWSTLADELQKTRNTVGSAEYENSCRFARLEKHLESLEFSKKWWGYALWSLAVANVIHVFLGVLK